jgi:hypothetical protein
VSLLRHAAAKFPLEKLGARQTQVQDSTNHAILRRG